MNIQKVFGPTAVVQVTTLETKSNKSPHDLIKEFVANKLGTDAYNPVFDRIYEIGLEQGTSAYDSAMVYALKAMGIEEMEVAEMLLEETK